MYPVLLNIAGIQFKSFGIFLLVAFLIAEYIIWREGSRKGYNEEKLLDLGIFCFIFAYLFGRVGYILLNLELYQNNWLSVLAFWEGGFDFVFCLIGGLVGFSYFIRKNKWPFFEVADFSAIALLVSYIIGQFGLFLSGDDTGKFTNLPWGVFNAELFGKRHPTGVYEILLSSLCLAFITFLYRRPLFSFKMPVYLEKLAALLIQKNGVIFFTSLTLLMLVRFSIGFLRETSGFFLASNLVMMLVFALGLGLHLTCRFHYLTQVRNLALGLPSRLTFFRRFRWPQKGIGSFRIQSRLERVRPKHFRSKFKNK